MLHININAANIQLLPMLFRDDSLTIYLTSLPETRETYCLTVMVLIEQILRKIEVACKADGWVDP